MEKIKNIPKKYMIAIIAALIVLVLYFSGAIYYNSHFLPKTFAGPIDVGQMTLSKAQEEVNHQLQELQINVSEEDEMIGYVTLGDLGVQTNTTEQLNQVLNEQNPFSWPIALFKDHQVDIGQAIELNGAVVENLIPSMGINNSNRQASIAASIQKQDDHTFAIVEETYGKQITRDSLVQTISDTVGKGGTLLELNQAYEKPRETTESDSLAQRMAEVEKMKSTSITLEFDGQSITIAPEMIASWIYLDEENNPQVDQELIEEYVLELNRQYSGLFLPRYFESTYQGTVQVNPGTYGWYIDRFEESVRIAEEIRQGAQVTREPYIGGSGYGMGDYVGSDYVEVDIAHQMMFIYRDGELVLDTPIVSGIIGAETIPGAYQVWNKEQDTDLVGYNVITQRDYVQPVSYWIPFDDQAQGIHDASWQANFGGNNYQSAGSQGCINTPPGIMPYVYDLVYIGMPVIIF